MPDLQCARRAQPRFVPRSGLRGPVGQCEDLVDRVGGTWRVTNPHRGSCVNSASPNRCTDADDGASEGNRIRYDADRVETRAGGQG